MHALHALHACMHALTAREAKSHSRRWLAVHEVSFASSCSFGSCILQHKYHLQQQQQRCCNSCCCGFLLAVRLLHLQCTGSSLLFACKQRHLPCSIKRQIKTECSNRPQPRSNVAAAAPQQQQQQQQQHPTKSSSSSSTAASVAALQQQQHQQQHLSSRDVPESACAA